MPLHKLKDLKNLKNKRVLVRVDFNIPFYKNKITDDTRIVAAIPTISYLIKSKAKVILMSHFSKPKEFDLVVDHLKDIIKQKVKTIDKWDFKKIEKIIAKIKPGSVLMLPNTRLYPGEETNSHEFGKELAKLGQAYVNEAFSASHRNHASLVSVATMLPRAAGFHLEKEIEILSDIFKYPRKPFIAMIGGAKIVDKLAMAKTLSKKASAILLGSSIGAHLFKASGFEVGASFIDPEGLKMAKTVSANKKLILPQDVIVGLPKDKGTARLVDVDKKVICRKPESILDIGPKTILEYSTYVKKAKTLLWAGPMGCYEIKRYSHGTMSLARLIASRSKGKAFGVVGGGETVSALRETGLEDCLDWVSTGGGALLKFLSGEKLPAIEVLLI